MAQDVAVKRIVARGKGGKAQLDVVFVHGLGGDSDDTWRASATEYWPQRVADDHLNVRVWTVSYPAKQGQLLTLCGMDQPGTAGLSVLITEKLRTNRIGNRPCIFVCHSLGGLIVKRILLDARKASGADQTRFKHEAVKAVMFCGTPHRGSAIASVLNGAEWVKSVALRNLLPYVGWLGFAVDKKAGELAASSILTTSDLISELEKNNVGLQHLNEDFGVYFRDRLADGFMVKVYAETEKLKVKGVPTTMVVSAESANPNLRFDSSAVVQVLPVPGVDHSELVKPTRAEDWVVEGLSDLIRKVGQKNYAFDLPEGIQQRVAMLLHAELRRWEGLAKLPCFRSISTPGDEDELVRFKVARALASLEGEPLIRQLSALKQGFSEVSPADDYATQKHRGLTRIGCTLLLAYMATEVASNASEVKGRDKDKDKDKVELHRVTVPALEDPEHLDILVEVLHATIRGWPVCLRLGESRKSLMSASRVLQSAAQATGSWRDEDHVLHLADRVLAAKTLTVDELAWPKEPEMTEAAGSEQQRRLKLREAARLLQSWVDDRCGLVIHALEPSSPYSGTTLQARLSQAFGELFVLVLPSPDPASDALLDKLSDIKIAAQQFLLEAERTRP